MARPQVYKPDQDDETLLSLLKAHGPSTLQETQKVLSSWSKTRVSTTLNRLKVSQKVCPALKGPHGTIIYCAVPTLGDSELDYIMREMALAHPLLEERRRLLEIIRNGESQSDESAFKSVKRTRSRAINDLISWGFIQRYIRQIIPIGPPSNRLKYISRDSYINKFNEWTPRLGNRIQMRDEQDFDADNRPTRLEALKKLKSAHIDDEFEG